ncbi:hypothetical protein HDV05_006362 [Chytridiales sp. JEL 0842]|nr:hypothetical protein HDV05_006362 [Chytridiales sp. JEL 0842]
MSPRNNLKSQRHSDDQSISRPNDEAAAAEASRRLDSLFSGLIDMDMDMSDAESDPPKTEESSLNQDHPNEEPVLFRLFSGQKAPVENNTRIKDPKRLISVGFDGNVKADPPGTSDRYKTPTISANKAKTIILAGRSRLSQKRRNQLRLQKLQLKEITEAKAQRALAKAKAAKWKARKPIVKRKWIPEEALMAIKVRKMALEYGFFLGRRRVCKGAMSTEAPVTNGLKGGNRFGFAGGRGAGSRGRGFARGGPSSFRGGAGRGGGNQGARGGGSTGGGMRGTGFRGGSRRGGFNSFRPIRGSGGFRGSRAVGKRGGGFGTDPVALAERLQVDVANVRKGFLIGRHPDASDSAKTCTGVEGLQVVFVKIGGRIEVFPVVHMSKAGMSFTAKTQQASKTATLKAVFENGKAVLLDAISGDFWLDSLH